MNIEELRHFCLSFPSTTEGFPFGGETLVFKVAGKMFALTGLEYSPPRVNLKCDPQKAIELREKHSSVQPGFHMSKTLWNTVIIDGSVDDGTLRSWIEDSYELIVKSLPKWKQEELKRP